MSKVLIDESLIEELIQFILRLINFQFFDELKLSVAYGTKISQ
jgi:hypothetical protein